MGKSGSPAFAFALILSLTAAAWGGTGVLSVPASNDGVPLGYGLFVPEGKPGKLPLVVDVMPTADTVELDVAKLKYYDLAKADAIVLRLPPFGRGGLQWSPFAERDAMQIIRHVMTSSPVDPDRVYLFGATQGTPCNGYAGKRLQFGTLALAYHYPDLFAAVVTSVGDLRGDAYRATWLGDWHQYQLQYEFPHLLREMPVLWAENLVNTPMWMVVSDVPTSRDQIQLYTMLDRFAPVELKLLNAPEVKTKGGGGTGALPDDVLASQLAWLLTHKRDMMPKRVVLTTNTLKYSTSRWVRIDALTELHRFCRLEARLTDDGRLKVRGENFEGFTLSDLDRLAPNAAKLSVDIEHQLIDVKPEKSVSFRRVKGKWEIGKVDVPPMAKTATNTDGVIDALREPYLLVVGTGGGAEAKLRALAADTINAIQNGGMTTPIDLSTVPVKTDAEVTADDMKRANLVLFGDERTNSIIAKINDRLPIRLDAGRIISGERTFSYPDQGLIMVYPNPLEPTRKVVVVTGAIFKGYLLTDKNLAAAPFPKNLPAHGFPMLGDWIIFRENGKAVAKVGRDLEGLNNAVVEGGWFDAAWRRGGPGCPAASDRGDTSAPFDRGDTWVPPYYFFNVNFAK
jgi:hypothetical protein